MSITIVFLDDFDFFISTPISILTIFTYFPKNDNNNGLLTFKTGSETNEKFNDKEDQNRPDCT